MEEDNNMITSAETIISYLSVWLAGFVPFTLRMFHEAHMSVAGPSTALSCL
jgi:hypothetical protein